MFFNFNLFDPQDPEDGGWPPKDTYGPENSDEGSGGGDDYRRRRSRASMQSASMVLGVLSIVTFMMIYISIPAGAIAIILALLSRGEQPEPGRAKTAISLAAAGMIASTAITGYAFYRVTTDPVLRRQMQNLVEYYSAGYLGESASEAFPWLFEKQSEAESETSVTWSDDLLNDHDRLVDYFLTPHGGSAQDSDSSDAGNTDARDNGSSDAESGSTHDNDSSDAGGGSTDNNSSDAGGGSTDNNSIQTPLDIPGVTLTGGSYT